MLPARLSPSSTAPAVVVVVGVSVVVAAAMSAVSAAEVLVLVVVVVVVVSVEEAARRRQEMRGSCTKAYFVVMLGDSGGEYIYMYIYVDLYQKRASSMARRESRCCRRRASTRSQMMRKLPVVGVFQLCVCVLYMLYNISMYIYVCVYVSHDSHTQT